MCSSGSGIGGIRATVSWNCDGSRASRRSIFGEGLVCIKGARVKVHCLVVAFPYSNMRWVVALPGENAECVCEGLETVFGHIGLAPRVLVFGNATGAAHRVA